MKIIPLHKDEKSLIRKAKNSNKAAQFGLYDRYAPKMLAVCKRYIRDVQYAEDVMIQGFLKVFMRLDTFKEKGSFEGWVRRIMVRECINFLKKNRRLVFRGDIHEYQNHGRPKVADKSDAEYLLRLIDQLPEASRLVFMLHAVEGYKHNEIAKVLRITENTSKTKLFKARRVLREKLKKHGKNYGTS
ncbi:RNA polymerase sigma factor [Allomuricauda sp. d1]|uniref:RNA polymerase sigma factor n=1 Tax=Allomuricauda sp. d1 TaxID=3136725 RepID=UPI0031E2F118